MAALNDYANVKNQDSYSPNPGINETVRWLLELGLPPLPVAPWHDPELGPYFNASSPGKPPEPKFTGKNPSFLTPQGRPILIKYIQYQAQLPDRELLKRWFAHPKTGVATMSGWRNVVWVDVDAKRFASVADCEQMVTQWIERYGLQSTYIERTHRGGYHIALRVLGAHAIAFTQFRFAEDGTTAKGKGKQAGEVLSGKYPIVLAPTVGSEGVYRCLNRGIPQRVESLAQVGVLPLRPLEQSTEDENSSTST